MDEVFRGVRALVYGSGFVASGPYRFVRNPMYVGAIALLTGLALVLEAPSVLGVALAAALFSNLFVIFVEELGLACRFGLGRFAAHGRAPFEEMCGVSEDVEPVSYTHLT